MNVQKMLQVIEAWDDNTLNYEMRSRWQLYAAAKCNVRELTEKLREWEEECATHKQSLPLIEAEIEKRGGLWRKNEINFNKR